MGGDVAADTRDEPAQHLLVLIQIGHFHERPQRPGKVDFVEEMRRHFRVGLVGDALVDEDRCPRFLGQVAQGRVQTYVSSPEGREALGTGTRNIKVETFKKKK